MHMEEVDDRCNWMLIIILVTFLEKIHTAASCILSFAGRVSGNVSNVSLYFKFMEHNGVKT